ncbi:undecaprenyl-diphosphate phosphatase [Belliella marina]|uniref:Undecaprenyl-diphosphatase n=1 Tax=Belliella marina TaxID=1644146 RepID=A0ABW4VMV2_9BACT
MTWIEALLLGIVQGLTEFLPISSSGHLELANFILGTEMTQHEALSYTVVLHCATALSTMLVLRKDLTDILLPLKYRRVFTEKHILVKIFLSTVPAGVVGLFFEKELSYFFGKNIGFTVFFLLITALLLYLTDMRSGNTKGLGMGSALLMGFAQAIALLPGISRSGSTIAAGVLGGVRRDLAAKFSFIMVLPLIFGKIVLDCLSGEIAFYGLDLQILLTGFFAAFISGYFACRFMLVVVQRQKLRYFSLYCILVVVGFLIYSNLYL